MQNELSSAYMISTSAEKRKDFNLDVIFQTNHISAIYCGMGMIARCLISCNLAGYAVCTCKIDM